MAIENTDLLVAYRPGESRHYKVSVGNLLPTKIPNLQEVTDVGNVTTSNITANNFTGANVIANNSILGLTNVLAGQDASQISLNGITGEIGGGDQVFIDCGIYEGVDSIPNPNPGDPDPPDPNTLTLTVEGPTTITRGSTATYYLSLNDFPGVDTEEGIFTAEIDDDALTDRFIYIEGIWQEYLDTGKARINLRAGLSGIYKVNFIYTQNNLVPNIAYQQIDITAKAAEIPSTSILGVAIDALDEADVSDRIYLTAEVQGVNVNEDAGRFVWKPISAPNPDFIENFDNYVYSSSQYGKMLSCATGTKGVYIFECEYLEPDVTGSPATGQHTITIV